MREPNDLDEFVAGHYEFDVSDVSRHVIRTVVLERVAALDLALNDVLAMRYSRDQHAADLLATSVLTRVSGDDRIKLLASMLQDDDLVDRWPFLVEVLKRVFQLRNLLAHGFVERVADGQLRITSVNRGATRQFTYDSRQLAWLAWQAQVTATELRALWAFLIPDVDDWFGPEPI